jgi:hypothetical protein
LVKLLAYHDGEGLWLGAGRVTRAKKLVDAIARGVGESTISSPRARMDASRGSL